LPRSLTLPTRSARGIPACLDRIGILTNPATSWRLKNLPVRGKAKIMSKLPIIVAVMIALFVAYHAAFPTYTYRYRLTVGVDVGGVTRTGSGVIEVKTQIQPKGIGNPTSSSVRGEAVAVDLGSRGALFVLITAAGSTRTADNIAPIAFGKRIRLNCERTGCDYRGFYQTLSQSRMSADLAPRDLPWMVTFHNLADPKSVVHVQPDNFTAAFGPGVDLKYATLELTSDPVSTGAVTAKLPWLSDLIRRDAALDGNPSRMVATNDLARRLRSEDFLKQ
jgi:hypothetical protein